MRKSLLWPHFIVLGLLGPLVLACQTRNQTTAQANPYSKLSDQELSEKARTFAKELHALNKEFRKITDGISAGDREGRSKLLRSADAIQTEYERKFATQARDLEKELLSRLPAGAKPKDVPSEIVAMLIKTGKLMGADPPDAIASYIEELTTRLPKVNSPRK